MYKTPRKRQVRVTRAHPEDDLQEQCVQWFRMQYPFRTLFAIPNGGKRSAREAARLKRQGVLAGVPDLFLALPTADYSGLFIEMKASGGRLTTAQSAMHVRLLKAGYEVVICYSFEEFKKTIKDYLAKIPKEASWLEVEKEMFGGGG